ncbi:hypothetical protein L246_40955 [Salmonella enterica subsp. enterica serovar Worthington str. BCH-5715]|nr:hypothetical protein L246_40955 [Salmonella enterica subsp. enterica serovar Worthington str. BCH-5715]
MSISGMPADKATAEEVHGQSAVTRTAGANTVVIF